MLASLSAQLTAAAATAQTVLGETFTIEGDTKTYTGVIDEPTEMLNATVNGLESVKELIITATRAQFTTAPSAAGRPKVTARSLTWTLKGVRIGPFHYHLTCVPSSSSFPPEELRKFSEGGRMIAAAMNTSVEIWARAEAGSILKRWAGITKVGDPKALNRSGIIRAYRDARRDVGFENDARKGSTPPGMASINLGFRSGPFGKVYYRTRNEGAEGGRKGFQDVYGPNFGSGKHIAPQDFPKVQRMTLYFSGIYKTLAKWAKESAGLSRQSIIQIADQLGIDLAKVPGTGISAAGVAKARAAIASTGKHYQNGYGTTSKSGKEFYLTLLNRYPKGGKIGMDRKLALVISWRMKYFRKNLETGALLSVERAARAYPYLKILKGPA